MQFAIDLPLPPGKNATNNYGKGRVFNSPEHAAWVRECDGIFMSLGLNRGRQPIKGRFAVKIFVREGIALDPQNVIDPLCDWAQHAGIVENDKHLRGLMLAYGDIGNDCRLVVEEIK